MSDRYVLHLGDCIEVMRTMADNSVDSIVTDPPYELGFMGKAWDVSGIAYKVGMWTQCLRVLKPGGHLLAFSGSRTYHRMACAIEDAGFELRDQIMWLYASGFPKSRNLGGKWQGWGTALKPAHEPISVARKPFSGTISDNIREHGTGALNIEASRVPVQDSQYARNCSGDRGHSATRRIDQEGVTNLHSGGGSAASGRWPANVICDDSLEVMQAFAEFSDETGSPARFFYCAKASRADRNEGVGGSDAAAVTTGATMRDCEDADWRLRNGNHHPTVKPTELMRYLTRLVTPPGGKVLDPFMGSGSTGKACMFEGFYFVGIDMTPEYVAIADARISYALKKSMMPRDARGNPISPPAVDERQHDMFETS